MFFTPWEFNHQDYMMIFHWSLSGSKSPDVNTTLLITLTDNIRAMVWLVSIHPQMYTYPDFFFQVFGFQGL